MIVGERIRSFIERVECIQAEIDGLNADKSEIFKEARGTGLDVKVIRALIKERRDPLAAREHSELVDLYRAAMNGTENATHARTRKISTPEGREAGLTSPAAPVSAIPIRSVEQTAATDSENPEPGDGDEGKRATIRDRAVEDMPEPNLGSLHPAAGEARGALAKNAPEAAPAAGDGSSPPDYSSIDLPAFLDRRHELARAG